MAEIHFGTDGWRAIIGEDFTNDNLVRVIDAAARVFKEDAVAAGRPADAPGTLIVGHDCRQDAHAYAQLAAEVAAAQSFRVLLTQDYCPTPTLCWSVAQNADAVGGIMLTSSHNPAEYLGVKLRMSDGGAAGKEFTDRVEAAFSDAPTDARGAFETVDLMTPYLATLKERVDVEAIRNANLRVVVDPLYGAGRIYLAELLRDLGVEVCEINNAEDPTFDGLHPEPIPPWVDRCIAKVPELGYDAGFINDGDADRIGAVDEHGNFVNPHRIITLLTSHLAEDKGLTGRVVSTITASAMLARQCKRLGLELTSTPVGFKWISSAMDEHNAVIGGESSGGLTVRGHIHGKDGIYAAALLVEMLSVTGKKLSELVESIYERYGHCYMAEYDWPFDQEMKERLHKLIMIDKQLPEFPEKVESVSYMDGCKVRFADGWIIARFSGTEPRLRIFCEMPTKEKARDLANLMARYLGLPEKE